MMRVDLGTAKQLATVRNLKLRVAQAKLFRAARESKERQKELSDIRQKQKILKTQQQAQEFVQRKAPDAVQDFLVLGALHVTHDGQSKIMLGKVDRARSLLRQAVREADAAMKVVMHAERGKERGKEVMLIARLQRMLLIERLAVDLADELAHKRKAHVLNLA